MKIYRTNDRIPVVIGKLTFWLSPLSNDQKFEAAAFTKMKGGKEVTDGIARTRFAIKHGVKRVDGLENYQFSNGEPLALVFEEDGKALTDDSVELLIELENSLEFALAAGQCLTGFREGTDIPGVTVKWDQVESVPSKKKFEPAP